MKNKIEKILTTVTTYTTKEKKENVAKFFYR